MTFRAILVLLGCVLAGAHAASDTYQRFEAFQTPPKNWRYFNPNQGFGYFPTGGTDGEAGGFFFPKTYTAYYADTSLNGTFHRGTPITAGGKIRLDEISFDPNYTNSVYIAHFRKGSTKSMFVNIIGMALTGTNQSTIDIAPIVQFSNGNAFVGRSIEVPVDSKVHDWSYTWTPTGGADGIGILDITIDTDTVSLTMGMSSAGLDYSIDSFGLYQPAFSAPNSNSYFVVFTKKLGYTAFVGSAPKIHVKGPKNIQASSSPVALAGTTHTTIGNRVTAVRYRVIHNGKTSRYKAASGTDRWTANVHVSSGSSRIEITAYGDNGLKTTAVRNVTRNP